MIRNYVKIAFRNLRRHLGYSLVNIVGMAVGLACCLLIFLFVWGELSYDRFHEDAERTYRVVQDEADGPGLAWSGPQMGILLGQDFSQIDAVMRVIDGANGYGTSATISFQDDQNGAVERFEEEGFLYADPDFFDFFSFSLVRGAPENVLGSPGGVVITESVAEKYFGEEEPVGKVLALNDQYELEVTGVAEDPPQHSHLTFRFVTSYETFYAKEGIAGEVNSFWWPPTHTYVKLQDDAAAETLRAALPAFMERHRDPDDADRMALALQPLTEIWLGPSYSGQQQAGGSISYVYLFSAIALFILILACINFTNLATARAVERMKEVGLRKVVGATRTQLAGQFLAESTLLTVVAIVLAIGLVELALPFFSGVMERPLSVPYEHVAFWTTLFVLIAVTGLVAGSYPAFRLSGFRPAMVLKGTTGRWLRGAGLRQALVVFQFAVSIVLLVGATTVYQQLRYVQQSNLGFDKEHVIVLPGRELGGAQEDATDGQRAPRYEALKAELLREAPIRQVTAANVRPGMMGMEGLYVWDVEGQPADANRQFPVQFVGEGFFEMLDLQMVAGRPLRAGDPADIGTARTRADQTPPTDIIEERALVINETAARRLGWTQEEALGKELRFYITENDIIYQDYRGTVVGVVQDYHAASLREPIGPVAYMPSRSPGGQYLGLSHVLVKVAPGSIQDAMQTLETIWTDIVPERPFEATFLDASLANMYQDEARFGRLISAFTVLAILIACLGLFGLAALTARQRTKEIGVRKVLGATVLSIVTLLSKDFAKLVIIAFVIAAPVAYLAMSRWLENFTYRIELGPNLFAVAGLLALFVALATVSYHALRAAYTDPARSLRYE